MKLIKDQNPTQNPSQNPTPEPDQQTETGSTSSGTDSPDFAAIEAQFSDFTDEPAGEGDSTPPGTLSKDDFYNGLKAVMSICGALPIPPFPLKSLPIQPSEEESARAASDEIYDICAETPWLQFMIKPDGKWVQRAMIIGGFAAVKVTAIRAEMKDRRMRDVSPAKEEPVGTKEDPIDIPNMDLGGGRY